MGAWWVGWCWKEGWKDGKTEERAGRVEGVWRDGWISMTWSRNPEKKRNKQKQEARTRQTLLNYRAETQQKRGEKRTETIKKTTKTA